MSLKRKRTSDQETIVDDNGFPVREGSYLMSRRGLLIGTASTGALLVGAYVSRNGIVQAIVPSIAESGVPSASNTGASLPEMWFEVPTVGPIVLYSPKTEMGQGIHTAIAQMAAEELEVRHDQLIVRNPPTTQSPIFPANTRGFGGLTATAGSTSTADVFGPLRQSAATLREMLAIEGATQLGVKRSEVLVQEGEIVLAGNASRKLTYGQIVAARKGELGSWKVPSKAVALKPARDFKVIGKEFARVDAAAKVSGSALYGYDARLPGMLFGAVVHPPRYGATLSSGAPGEAGTMPGVVKVVIDVDANFAGVVAKTRSQARAAADALKLAWKGGSNLGDREIAKQLSDTKTVTIHQKGNTADSLNGEDVVSATYETPFAAHAHFEPISALASVTADHVEVWSATQSQEVVAGEVNAALKKKRVVTLYPTYLGGGFGRKFIVHAAAEAVRLSEAVGKPVHVGWTREQDMAFGPFRPPTTSTLKGKVDDRGRIVAIDQETRTGEVTALPGFAANLLGFDPGAMQGQFVPYEFANYRVKAGSTKLDAPTGIWRGVGLLPNVFALETFIDELAHAAKRDPLGFRIDNLPTDDAGRSIKRLLQEVAKRSDWSAPLPAGRGRGVACSASSGTTIVCVAQVAVEGDSIKVEQVFVCADPGLVINPAGARLQISGAVMMSLSTAFHENVSFAKGMAVQQNFDEYQILGLMEAPPVDVHLMGSGDVPAGLGEPGVGPVCAAIGNAIFAASGKRLRSMPFTLSPSLVAPSSGE
jgi:isoquinoline 1-oxidoreductase subunit beta